MRKPTFITIISLAGLITVSAAVFSIFGRSSLTIDLSGTNVPTTTKVTVNGKYVGPQGAGGLIYVFSVRPGKAIVEIDSPSHGYYKEELNLGFGSKKSTGSCEEMP